MAGATGESEEEAESRESFRGLLESRNGEERSVEGAVVSNFVTNVIARKKSEVVAGTTKRDT